MFCFIKQRILIFIMVDSRLGLMKTSIKAIVFLFGNTSERKNWEIQQEQLVSSPGVNLPLNNNLVYVESIDRYRLDNHISPNLNPVKIFWSKLVRDVHAHGRLFSTIEELQ